MLDKKKKSINILGAGISGLSAAINLQKHKISTKIIEKKSHAGGRFIREFQCLRNFGYNKKNPIEEFKKLNISIKPCKELKKIIRYSKSHHFEIISDNKPIYYLVLRGKDKNSIDSQLADKAQNYGVDIQYKLSRKISDVDIVATGPRNMDSLAYGEIYEDANIDDTVHIFLNATFSPKGYLYILPGERKGEVEIINGTCDPSIPMITLKQLYNKAIKENPILKNVLNGASRKSIQGGIGCFSLMKKPYHNGRYYIGEVAGLQDITAGFGIRYAIMSGYLAAYSIINSQNYNNLVYEHFTSQLEFEKERSRKFGNMTNDDIDKMFKYINDRYGKQISIEEYETLRGEI